MLIVHSFWWKCQNISFILMIWLQLLSIMYGEEAHPSINSHNLPKNKRSCKSNCVHCVCLPFYYNCVLFFRAQIIFPFNCNVCNSALNIYKCIIQILDVFHNTFLVVSAVSHFFSLQQNISKWKCFYFSVGFNACWYHNTVLTMYF